MNQKQIKSLGSKIKKAVRSKVGEEILDYYRMNLWTEGGCFALAHAIREEYGGELFALVDAQVRPKIKPYAQHVVVWFAPYYLDGDGAQTEKELLDRWDDILESDAELVSLDDATTEEIRCDQNAIAEIRELLRKKIGPA